MTKEIIFLAVSSILIQNFVLVRFLGICSFLGVSQRIQTSLGMGMAVTFVMVMASVCTWTVNNFLLLPFGLGYLQTVAFILIIASLVQLVELFIRRISPALYSALGIYLPLIATNCAILGVVVLNVQEEYNLGTSILFSAFSAIGYTLAMVLMAGVRERLETADIPDFLQGMPIALITGGLIAMSFLGFAGMSF